MTAYDLALDDADSEDLDALQCAADLLDAVLADATCPICDGPCVYLGALGPVHWLRCRNCGLDHHRGPIWPEC